MPPCQFPKGSAAPAKSYFHSAARAIRPLAATAILAGASLAQAPAPAPTAEEAGRLTRLIQSSPKLPWKSIPIEIPPPHTGWNTGYISSSAASKNGELYLLHRNLNEHNVVVIGRDGRIRRAWGKGLYANPHSVRLDPDGNVWTVDSGSSTVLKFTPRGEFLLRIEIGEIPEPRQGSRGAADIAFAPGGRLFIADGYGNARILEYDAQGRRVRQWGSAGTNPGQFHLPHGITQFGGVLYVADRQNGRIQRFGLDGDYLGEWNHLGKTFSITAAPDGTLWIGSHPRNAVNEAPGWLVQIDRQNGRVLGYLDSPGLHSVDCIRPNEILSDPGRGNLNRLLLHRP